MTLAELLEKLDKKHTIKLKNGEDHHKLGDDIKVTVYDEHDEEIYFSDCSNVETELEDEDFKNFIVFDFNFKDQFGYEDMKSKQSYEIYAIKKKDFTQLKGKRKLRMAKLIITCTNGVKANVSDEHGVDFENMTEAIDYLKQNFVTDEIAEIKLIED